jgi:alpha-tubulin suppressor-like RCC1 family protein
VPVVVSGLDSVKSVSAGTYHTCALKTDGTVACWGTNASGQLGNGRDDLSLVPVMVAGLSGVAQLAAGFGHNCVVLANGTLACWGLNMTGQVGDGTGLYYTWMPVAVDGLTQVVEVTAGSEHTCARTRDYRLYCWGANRFGQFGDGTVDGSLRPFELTSAWPRLIAVSAGAHVTCGVNSDGNVMCSGFNFRGELGDSGAIPSRTPVQVLPPSERTR